MVLADLVPPGRVWWALRDGALHPAHRRAPAGPGGTDTLRLFEVREPRTVFGQLMFAGDMLRCAWRVQWRARADVRAAARTCRTSTSACCTSYFKSGALPGGGAAQRQCTMRGFKQLSCRMLGSALGECLRSPSRARDADRSHLQKRALRPVHALYMRNAAVGSA
jgi:hypothetical protein